MPQPSYFEASMEALRNSLRSFSMARLVLRARVPAALLPFRPEDWHRR